MLRMYGRRLSQIATALGTDQVMIGYSLPSDTVIHDFRLRAILQGTTTTGLAWLFAHMYAVESWILPVLDPDSGATYDTLWDQLVPKDTDVQTMDLDTGAVDASPFYEPGEADWSSVLDVGLRPERLYHKHKIMTATTGRSMAFQDSQSPFNVLWVAGDVLNIHIKRRLRVRQPSVLVTAIATPNLNDTTATVQGILGESEWGQVKYAGNMLERALLHLFGVTEAGAETPWEEATAVLQKHLDPEVYEESGGAWGAEQYRVWSEAMLDHSVVGEIGRSQISTGR